MRIVITGHVDHGKSTLIGRLFQDTGAAPEGRLEQLRDQAARRGAPFELANLTDGLTAEREQNVTIDAGEIVLRRPHDGSRPALEITFVDAPGHRQFLANMLTGAARADAAVIVVDASAGVADQTRRHLLVLKLLGYDVVHAVVNKVDVLERAQESFEAIRSEIADAVRSAGLETGLILPASALLGWNVVGRAPALSWFEGPTFLDLLERLERLSEERRARPPRETRDPLVFVVQDVYRQDARRLIVGRALRGRLSSGAAVEVLPAGHSATIDPLAGGIGALTIREPLFVTRGDVLADASATLSIATAFSGRLVWLLDQPLAAGARVELRVATQHADARIARITRSIDAGTMDQRPAGGAVGRDDVAEVEIEMTRPVVIDGRQADERADGLARFVLVDPMTGAFAAAGVVLTVARSARAGLETAAARVSPDERRRRFGHGGAVIWLTGLSGSGKSTLAVGLERALFARGANVTVLDGDSMRFGLSADLGFSAADRRENIRRAAEAARLLAETGAIVVTAFISPAAADRARARSIVAEPRDGRTIPFAEVFVNAPIEVCERRDPKGLYRKARAGDIAEFTGVSAPYDVPDAPDLMLATDVDAPDAAVTALVELAERLSKA